MSLPQGVIAEARKRQECKKLERAFLAQFGEEVEYWFSLAFDVDADGAPEVRITHKGVPARVWCDGDGIWYVEGEALDFDPRAPEEASDALIVAIDDLAPVAVEQATEA
jgi:hypothetical protein